ncbi:MAG: hypothetical protein KatS3mg110_0429 [Pirellulaceae bacterium]|nr:MAG: hypothetical protein KatS3mg110_0429 [Pirellulaceae bacterium]
MRCFFKPVLAELALAGLTIAASLPVVPTWSVGTVRPAVLRCSDQWPATGSLW